MIAAFAKAVRTFLLTITSISSSMSAPQNFATREQLLSDSTIKHIRELLRAHAEPPEHLPRTVSAVSEELARYDQEIARLHAQLRRIEADRALLQAHYDDSRGFLAPIRRLPSEILVKIFEICRQFKKGPTETHRLVQAPLLTVAQVCSRWHGIAMGTPTLWNTIVVGRNLPQSTNTLELVGRALDRSADSTLNISVHGSSTLKLLAAHSERWKTARFWSASYKRQHFAGVKGRVPLLETLELNSYATGSEDVDCFEVAPNLRSLTVSGSLLSRMATPPLAQLRFLACTTVRSDDIASCMSRLSELSPTTHLHLELILDNRYNIPPTSSHALELSIGAIGLYDVHQVLLEIFTSLTLPHLRDLRLTKSMVPSPAVPAAPGLLHWAHGPFLSLAERSSFHNHLLSLDLSSVDITPGALVECLSNLPSLQQLAISEDPYPYGRKETITDAVLENLTLAAGSPCLVPRLRIVKFHTLLQFDDNIFQNFLASRVQAGNPFQCDIRAPGHYRDLDPAIITQIDELCVKKGLIFSFETANFTLCTSKFQRWCCSLFNF
ncbi:hypothetical protein DFH09DRAFT_1360691 [Mycena vulgaris]|nr:hypothetical protein DFH09DRAFT_1360691 [Mycena vulgaris]